MIRQILGAFSIIGHRHPLAVTRDHRLGTGKDLTNCQAFSLVH